MNETLSVTVDGPDDHSRAVRDICLAVADVVQDAIEQDGHPVEITVDMEVESSG